MKTVLVLLVLCLVNITYSRDFYFGMFQRNDFLVAADEIYKPRSPSRITWAKYGKVFKCPITYFRVVDRLGSISSPRVEIIRGGILKKYIVVRLSVYNQPISVNIYIGCANKNRKKPTTRLTSTTAKPSNDTESSAKDEDKLPESTVEGEVDTTTVKTADDNENETDKPAGDEEENRGGDEAKPDEEPTK